VPLTAKLMLELVLLVLPGLTLLPAATMSLAWRYVVVPGAKGTAAC
jgi:hypothetical protein